MRIGRTIPPAAAPIPWQNILKAAIHGLNKSVHPVNKFQKELEKYFGVKHCFLVGSGKSALTLILSSLHDLFPERNEVLIPAFTCFSVPAAIIKAGLEIKLCDMGLNSLDFDHEIIGKIAKQETLNQRLLCVIPTHLFGYPADVKFCREAFPDNVAVIEDAAQAMGNDLHGVKLGTIGDIGFLSLGRGKALSTMEGGIIVTNRDDIGLAIKKRLLSLPNYGTVAKIRLFLKAFLTNLLQNPSLFWLPKSLPFLHLGETVYDPEFTIKKLSPLQAILASDWQTTLSKYQKVRTENVQFFTEIESDQSAGSATPLQKENLALIRLPRLTKSEKALKEIMKTASAEGLGVMPAYPSPINEIQEIQGTFDDHRYPRAQLLSKQLVTIPTHNYMRKRDYQQIERLLTLDYQ